MNNKMTKSDYIKAIKAIKLKIDKQIETLETLIWFFDTMEIDRIHLHIMRETLKWVSNWGFDEIVEYTPEEKQYRQMRGIR